ncbi:hypothetical protein WG66_007993 [Moniliophthora roreri]|nr:hypothetical protein WG66_007993 [Moniliophthora roreri]
MSRAPASSRAIIIGITPFPEIGPSEHGLQVWEVSGWLEGDESKSDVIVDFLELEASLRAHFHYGYHGKDSVFRTGPCTLRRLCVCSDLVVKVP